MVWRSGSDRTETVGGIALSILAPMGSRVNKNVKYSSKIEIENFEKRKTMVWRHGGYNTGCP